MRLVGLFQRHINISRSCQEQGHGPEKISHGKRLDIRLLAQTRGISRESEGFLRGRCVRIVTQLGPDGSMHSLRVARTWRQ